MVLTVDEIKWNLKFVRNEILNFGEFGVPQEVIDDLIDKQDDVILTMGGVTIENE